jgi:hypothetical protein
VELALNLVWLLLSGVSLLLWATFALLFPDQRRLTAGIALVCVIVFLFPVISATDDLSNIPAVCETGKFGKLKKWVSAELDGALLFSAAVLPRPRAQRVPNLNSEGPSHSPETVWSGLERRPPPLTS